MSSVQFESDGENVILTLDEHDFSKVMLGLYHLATSKAPIIDPEGAPYYLTDKGMEALVEFYNELDEHATSFFLDRQAAKSMEVVHDG